MEKLWRNSPTDLAWLNLMALANFVENSWQKRLSHHGLIASFPVRNARR
jgi:hypothetical protein